MVAGVDAVVRDANDPEEPVGENAGVEIVNLRQRICQIREDVESYQAEGAVMVFPVFADVLALHEPEIDFVVERRFVSGARRSTRASRRSSPHAV